MKKDPDDLETVISHFGDISLIGAGLFSLFFDRKRLIQLVCTIEFLFGNGIGRSFPHKPELGAGSSHLGPEARQPALAGHVFQLASLGQCFGQLATPPFDCRLLCALFVWFSSFVHVDVPTGIVRWLFGVWLFGVRILFQFSEKRHGGVD
ncbi:hypothetical protein N656DRAFT_467646 [Canariomyces notabilis]|uniref:Uncharacterized protein n=1 Tax=Canariomyces notabilis TaxID=2074819 RepID=A0AAN6QDX9_9PEZI|nr:hypothetical protein N656DRAFT_467646 [Canariomyces arenarius]